MSEFLLEKSRRNNMQVSQSRQKLWKEWHFISQSMTQPAEVICMVVVHHLNYPTVAKAQ